MRQLYFDHAASAPRRESVAAAMEPWLHGVVGNPSGSHRAARVARRAIEEAREVVAGLAGVAPGGVVFTAGGSESCHLALAGVVGQARREGREPGLVVSEIEHHAVLESAWALARDLPGVTCALAPAGPDGVVGAAGVAALVGPATALVSVMAANNETGVVQPIDEIAATVRDVGPRALVHSDAIAAAPWVELGEITSAVDLTSICAHKLGGPVNAGALLLSRDVPLEAVVPGGSQERGRRGGTVDVAAVVGLAAAMAEVAREREDAVSATSARRDRLAARLATLPGVVVTAAASVRLPGTVHVTVAGVASDELLFLLDQRGVCASAASSCASGAGAPSHVLEAMGVARERARGALRLTFGSETSDEEIDLLVAAVTESLEKLTGGSAR